MKRCHCHACRARDARRFQRIIRHNYTRTAETLILVRETDRAIRAIIRRRASRLLPPIPEWEGEPAELRLPGNRER